MSPLSAAAAALAPANDPLSLDATAPAPKPFIKWVGGKRRLVPELLRQAPRRFGRYHEPFVGGGALFFGLAEEHAGREGWACLSDTNLRLVRTYRAVRDDVEGLVARLRDYADAHDKDQYYAVRALDVDAMDDDADVAAWFIYLNKTGFNGLYRVNRKGGFNVPMGRYKKPNICDGDNLRACHRVLQGVEIHHEGFEQAEKRAVEGDFVYFDPPYVPASATSNFTAYTRDGFGLGEQEKLRDVARDLKNRGVRVILSNSDTPPVRSLYQRGFAKRQVMMTRAVNSQASKRGGVPELLIS
ncbi:MAG: DNA adenine methylase [Myxococcota bacterium]|nr:DNA adenine methylase [Myxococcota bacterium]